MQAVKTDIHFPDLEKGVLEFWKRNSIVEKGLNLNKGKKEFIFFDGPPFATGLPHYGHVLPGTLKDIVPRYWAMRGFYVQRRWGWDCHGLPVEFEMEKELGISGPKDVEKIGIAHFNESCRGIVLRYTKQWQTLIERTGRWVDFEHNYRTMDASYMESVWWVFKQLWDKNLIYEGHRVMPYSWRIGTALSNFEAGLNYKEVQDPAITVRFKALGGNYYFLAWTTTPWTLPSNMALAVNANIEYAEVADKPTGDRYILATERLSHYYKTSSEYTIVRKIVGKQLEGERYEPLFPYFAEKSQHGAFRVLLGDYVTVSDGTGIVHTAPAFGEDDFIACHKYQLPIVNPVDYEGKFTHEASDYAGQHVKDADKNIVRDLKNRGLLVRHETINHQYPFCWRSDTPLIYRLFPAWFVKLEPIKQALLANNSKTHWVPEHLRDGRFGNWLQNARDWNISRNRYWGTPIPLWRCLAACGGIVCIGSMDELEKASGKRPSDIHKHFVDSIEVSCPKCHLPMKRVPEVLDCWFESGSMPYGQVHYPTENKENFEKYFPADFIAEGIDQTRGWFYTLSVLSTALFNEPPFKHVIVNGLVLAEDGKKMSKRLKNYPELGYVLERYGADALRAYLTASPAAHAEELRFCENTLTEMIRSVLLPFWNAYAFFVTYAKADGWQPSESATNSAEQSQKQSAVVPGIKLSNQLTNQLDNWILSRLHSLIRFIDEKMQCYHLYEILPRVVQFIDDLTNWYIRLNRRRFWQEGKNEDKQVAYQTLYDVLLTFTKVLAPLLPFITEEIYQNLYQSPKDGPSKKESVHFESWPVVNSALIDARLQTRMELIQSVVSLGRNIRNTNNLKIRQPLKELLVITKDPDDRQTVGEFESVLSHELNVKKVSFSSDEKNWVNFAAKANAKILGPRLGSKMKAVLQKIKALPSDQVSQLEIQGKLVVDGEIISAAEITIERQPKRPGLIQTLGNVTIWLDTSMEPALIAEGRAREVVNRIQKLRKDLDLDVTDRITVTYACDAELKKAIEQFQSYIVDETLTTVMIEKSLPTWHAETDIDGLSLKLAVERV